jgi:hypothetical protein
MLPRTPQLTTAETLAEASDLGRVCWGGPWTRLRPRMLNPEFGFLGSAFDSVCTGFNAARLICYAKMMA